MPRKKALKPLTVVQETTVLTCPKCQATLMGTWSQRPRELEKIYCPECNWIMPIPAEETPTPEAPDEA